MKGYTTIEQSKKLLELGFDPNTADMHWWITHHSHYAGLGWSEEFRKKTGSACQPAWSLSALLDEIPQSVITDNGDEYTLQMGKDDDLTYVFGYYCEYTATNVVEFVSQEAVEAAYELICWLLENKYV